MEVHSDRSGGTQSRSRNEALCLEILGLCTCVYVCGDLMVTMMDALPGVLRRCLGQQNKVKVLLYQVVVVWFLQGRTLLTCVLFCLAGSARSICQKFQNG